MLREVGLRSVGFVRRQANDIRTDGLEALSRKLRRVRSSFLENWKRLVLLPLILLVRMLRPMLLIRIGRLRSNRMGHFCADTELYLCRRDAGIEPKRTIDVFYYTFPVSNEQLAKMWQRKLTVWSWGSLLDETNRWVPGSENHVVRIGQDMSRDLHGLYERIPPHLSFTSDEHEKGQALLRSLGVPGGESYVCMFARDTSYLDSAFPGKNWEYHDYRNFSVQDCLAAARECATRGYYVLRMGSVVREPLSCNDPMIIDYATIGRTDFMDVYLAGTCRFFLGSASGITEVSQSFRRPIALINYLPLETVHSWHSQHLVIPKKLFLRDEKRFMTFREIIESGAGRYYYTQQYDRLGVDVVENTPDEIRALTVEMDERLNGTWETTEEDQDLQQRFWSLFRARPLHEGNPLHGEIRSRIGAEFLRQHRDLLS